MDPREAKAQFDQAWSLRNKGEYDKVLEIAENGLESMDDPASRALFLKLMAQVQSDKDELREALTTYKKMEKLYIELGNVPRQMHALRHIGSTFYALEEFECAEKCLIQVVEAYEANPPNVLELANTHRLYALALEARNSKPAALTFWQKAKEGYASLDLKEGVEECEGHLSS